MPSRKGGGGTLVIVRHLQTTRRLGSLHEALFRRPCIAGTPQRFGQFEYGFSSVSVLFACLIDRLASGADGILEPSKVAISNAQAHAHEDSPVGPGRIANAVGETLFEYGRSLGSLAIARECTTERPYA